MRRLLLAAIAGLALLAIVHAEDRKVYLKRAAVRGELSRFEADKVSASFQSKLTLPLLQRSGYGLVNDDDLVSLMDEAEAEAAQTYQQAASYLAAGAAEMDGRGSDMTPFIDQRLLLAFGSMMAASLSEAEKHYMDYEFGQAGDVFSAAVKIGQSCPLYGAVSALASGRGTPEQLQFASLLQAATDGARKSRETALSVFLSEASVYKDRVIIFDVRDERQQAKRALEEMGSYIGVSRYRMDAVALGHLKTACGILRRQPDALLLATPAVRAAIKDYGIVVKAGSAYVLVQTDEEAVGQVAVSVGGGTTGRAAAADSLGSMWGKGSTGWRAVAPSARRIEVGTVSQAVDLVAGRFYAITVYAPLPLGSILTDAAALPGHRAAPARPAPLDLLTSAVGLQGYKTPPVEPDYQPEYRDAKRRRVVIGETALLALPSGVLAFFIVGGIASDFRAGVGGALVGTAFGFGLGVAIETLVRGPVTWVREPLPANIAANRQRRASWGAQKRPIDQANQRLLDEENRRRKAENQRLLDEWQKQVAEVEQGNKKLLDEANARISAENLVIQEKNRERGRIEVVDIGSYEPVTMP